MEHLSGDLASGIRRESLRLLEELGYASNPTLPLLEVSCISRSARELASRALVLHACCAASYGFPIQRARAWITDNALMDDVSPTELRFLRGEGHGEPFKWRPEAIWALCWVLKKARDFKLHEPMPQTAVSLLPDLQKGEAAQAWLASCADVRGSLEVIKALDFYYCAHWALNQFGSSPTGKPKRLPGYAIVERRRALEWCFVPDDWDWVRLDT